MTGRLRLRVFSAFAGLRAIRVCGAVVSRRKLRVATAELPAPSVARTRKVQVPSASGDPGVWPAAVAQGPKAAEPRSIEHWRVVPGSAEKTKSGVASLVSDPGAEVMPTAGASVSIVKTF